MRANVGNLLNEVQVISYNGKENFCCFLFLCFHCHESITQGEKNRHWRNLKKNLPLNFNNQKFSYPENRFNFNFSENNEKRHQQQPFSFEAEQFLKKFALPLIKGRASVGGG